MTWMQAYIVKLAELKVIHSSPLSMVDVNHQHLKMRVLFAVTSFLFAMNAY